MTKQTQEARILEALKNGERITAYKIFLRCGSMRLGARIYDLKRKGYKIEKRMINISSGAHVAEYWMEA
jgi:hypothetical protein